MVAEPSRDIETVTRTGEPVRKLPEGVVMRDTRTHPDDRGIVFELYDPRWNVHPAPMVFSYCFTTRPGKAKGWAVHREHDDRYVILFGELMVVLYDERPDSSTYGMVSEIMLTQDRRQLLTIPAGVWHANLNLGSTDAIAVNFPTVPYNHAHPDKYRLPLDTDRIPYRFEARTGW